MRKTAKLKPNQFRCVVCGKVFTKGMTDGEALAELSDQSNPRHHPDEFMVKIVKTN
jgi:PHP family Zn ribbon phosphoesterase